jgi:hypothetical protein
VRKAAADDGEWPIRVMLPARVSRKQASFACHPLQRSYRAERIAHRLINGLWSL